ncbi:hypothetical protein ScPMuIL_012425 [Solemya velum]
MFSWKSLLILVSLALSVTIHSYGRTVWQTGEDECVRINNSWLRVWNSDRFYCSSKLGSFRLGLKELGLPPTLPVVMVFLAAAMTNYVMVFKWSSVVRAVFGLE